ncbi:hypothetical protein RF11_02041 [Thelohanellus kitauei]|nr:hypothetical protein RF11_02041 [Thelohanellus kitauei]
MKRQPLCRGQASKGECNVVLYSLDGRCRDHGPTRGHPSLGRLGSQGQLVWYTTRQKEKLATRAMETEKLLHGSGQRHDRCHSYKSNKAWSRLRRHLDSCFKVLATGPRALNRPAPRG